MDSPLVVIPIVAGVGNALMAMPMVRELKAAMPGARITIVARTDAMTEPFRRMPEVDETIVKKGVGSLFGAIRSRRADVLLVPFPSNRWQYSVLALFSGARRKILHGYPRGYWRALGFVGERMPAERGLHDVEQNLRLLKLLGIESNDLEAPRFAVTDADHARATQILAELEINSSASFIAVHAGSGATTLARAKRWPIEKYAQLIRLMRSKLPHEIFVLQGPDERGVGEQIVQAVGDEIGGVHLLPLSGPLGDAAAILERAALYVGSDSGLAHLAAAVGTRAVTLFAPSDPERVCPFANRDLVVQSTNSCAPCLQYPWHTPYPKIMCRQPYCIDGIEVERVLEKVKGALPVPSPIGRALG